MNTVLIRFELKANRLCCACSFFRMEEEWTKIAKKATQLLQFGSATLVHQYHHSRHQVLKVYGRLCFIASLRFDHGSIIRDCKLEEKTAIHNVVRSLTGQSVQLLGLEKVSLECSLVLLFLGEELVRKRRVED